MQKEKINMVQTCSAYNCSERWKKGSDISFHLLPKDVNLRTLWIFAMGGEDFNPSSHARICSKHFTPDCFVENPWNARRELKPDAVPSIFEATNESKGNIVPIHNESGMNDAKSHDVSSNVEKKILIPSYIQHGSNRYRIVYDDVLGLKNTNVSSDNAENIGSVLRNVRNNVPINPSVPSILESFPDPKLITDCVTSTILAVSNPEIGEYRCACESNSKKPQILDTTQSIKTTGVGIQALNEVPIPIPLQEIENEGPQRRKRLAYFGDFSEGESDFDKYREVARRVLQKKNVQVRTLQQKNRRLIKKVEKLKSVLITRNSEDSDEESSSEASSEAEAHLQGGTEVQMGISEETAHLENTQFDQEGSPALQDIVKTERGFIKQEGMNDTMPSEDNSYFLQEQDQRDACSFFGEYVAAELRSLPVEERFSLQQCIQSCICAALVENSNNSSVP